MADDSATVAPTMYRCAACGYNLSGATIGGRCPECGMEVGQSLQAVTAGPRSCGAATAAMVLGILSLTICGILGPFAIVSASQANRQMAQGGYSDSSRTMAKAGMIMGVISTIMFAGAVLLLVVSAAL